ncbi:MAG: DUF5011 domain-containing protein [Candidatus Nitrosoabyssus spongiisocia]|nr:MAG: DUF5011 domain-containing protein [Nitrosopumilaceae archaeon AB1(1)]
MSPTLLHIDVPLIVTPEHQNVTINYTAASFGNTITITAGLNAKLVSTNDITVTIPTSTNITHDGTWDSQFLAPRNATITVPSTTVGQIATSHVTITAITLGDTTTDSNLNKVASLLFENQGGNNYSAYYANSTNSAPTSIFSCGTSNIAEINTLLTTTSTNECFVDDNTHVTIYTTHLSTYALISSTNTSIGPLITLIGNATVYVELGSSYSEQNATTNDGSLVIIGGDTVNSSLKGNYTVTYNSVDSAGNNATQVNRLVIVSDTIPPVITLNGNSTITLSINSTYNEQNATTDDGSPVTIGGDTVNSSLKGNYTVTYNSVDSAGNNATQVVRTVMISNASDTTPPVITLIGNATVYVELDSSYSEQNATTDDGSLVTIGGDTVNSSLVGNYTVTYNSVDSAGNNATQVNRFVIVSDTTPPVITLNGNSTITLSINSTYNEQNATTDDGSPIVIRGDTVDTNTIGNYTITYHSVDSSGNNATQVNRTVIVRDTTPPVITLNGNDVVYVELGSSYSEQNATTDDDSSIVIRGDTVDTNTIGNYTITYHSVDSSGNDATQVNRTVIVRNTTPPVITLNGNDVVYVELG